MTRGQLIWKAMQLQPKHYLRLSEKYRARFPQAAIDSMVGLSLAHESMQAALREADTDHIIQPAYTGGMSEDWT